MRLILRFLRGYAVPYWPWYLLGLAALYATNQLTVWVPRFIKEALDAFGAGDQATSMTRIWWIVGASIAIVVIRTTSRICFFNPGRAAEFRLKNHLFRHLESLPQSFHDSSRVGDLMSRSTNDLQSVRALIGFAGLQLLEAAFIIPMSLYQMVLLDAKLTGVIFAMLLIALAALYASAQIVVRVMRENLEQLAALSDHILDTYTAIPVVQGFCAQPAFRQKFASLNAAYVRNGLIIARIRAFLLPVVTLVGGVCVGTVLWWGGGLVMDGRLSVGSIAAYSGYIGILVARMMSFGWTLTVVQRGMVSLRRIYDLLDTKPDLPPVRAALPAPVQAPDDGGSGYRIEVRDLTFTYPGATDRGPALSGLSFGLEPGRTLGIFGHTGSGKSTLVHLLARVYTPPPGTVFVNGVDVCDVPIADLRSLLALVPQDPFLFSRSIRDNIRFGAPETAGEAAGPRPAEAEPGAEPEVMHAVRLACFESDLQAIPQGLDTVVGARGITLSGGQRQRVALARAFYRPFRILLLDDVLAAVDHQTERQLIQNIYSLAGTGVDPEAAQTTIIISHRISALQHADEILVLEHGRVVDRGSHAELVAHGGVYADTWRVQLEAMQQEAVNG